MRNIGDSNDEKSSEISQRREVLLHMEENEKIWLDGDVEKVENWFNTPDEDFHHLLKQHSKSELLFPTRQLLMEYDLRNLSEEQEKVKFWFSDTVYVSHYGSLHK